MTIADDIAALRAAVDCHCGQIVHDCWAPDGNDRVFALDGAIERVLDEIERLQSRLAIETNANDVLAARVEALMREAAPDDRPTRNVRGTLVPVGAWATIVRGVSHVNGEVFDRVVWFDFADTTGPVEIYIERQIGRPI